MNSRPETGARPTLDLSRVRAGEVLDLSPRDAGVLLVEGWSLPIELVDVEVTSKHEPPLRSEAADGSRSRN